MRPASLLVLVALVLAAIALLPVACASSDDPGGQATGGAPSGGLAAGSGTTTGQGGGGTGGAGSAGGTGGTSVGAGGGSSGSGGSPAAVCPHEGPPVINPSTFPPCPMCDGGHCVPNALVPSAEAGQLASCDSTSICVPDPMIASGGNFILPTCMSVAGFEGRCASVCIPQVASQASSLPQSSCASDEVCAPCYDPLTGADTGVCHLSCDPGPAGPPQTLPACCGGIGTCVPSSTVPADKAGNFDATGCSAIPGLLCVPDAFVPDATPPSGDVTNQSCTTGWWFQAFFGFNPLYANGVCLPTCMPEVGSQSFLVDDGSCGSDAYKCVPCNDPTNNGAPTGACSN